MNTTVVVGGAMAPMMFGEVPVTMQCPHCQAQITTRISYHNGTLVWVAILVLCLLG